ncbi:hypothetical protein HDV00_005672 [Rhizophlyctis rosea]|nr:hypothetical protein HDV00_005672 [Rhizophlyctis rosea]
MRGIGYILRFLFTRHNKTATIAYSETNPRQRCLVFRPINGITPSGLYINFHGGGWAGGMPDEDAEFCAYLAEKANLVVISGQYRFAPEHPFPVGLNDAFAVAQWARQKFGQGLKVAVGGFSAGGTLAFGIAQLMAKAGTPVNSVATFYPPMDMSPQSKSLLPERNPWKRDLFHEAYLLKTPHNSLTDPLLSPMYAPASDLPDSLIMLIPEIDPNGPDMLDFCKRVADEKGVKPLHLVLEKCFHGWDKLSEWLIGKERTEGKWKAYELVVDEMKRVLH